MCKIFLSINEVQRILTGQENFWLKLILSLILLNQRVINVQQNRNWEASSREWQVCFITQLIEFELELSNVSICLMLNTSFYNLIACFLIKNILYNLEANWAQKLNFRIWMKILSIFLNKLCRSIMHNNTFLVCTK